MATIVQLGRTLNMRTVAEGIQTEAQVQALVEMGCEYGQGYYFSRPVPGLQFERLLRGESNPHLPTPPRPRPRTPVRAS